MANTISVECVDSDEPGAPLVDVKVKVESPGERDLSAKMNGVDLIQQIASALRLSVTISEMHGDADNAD